MTTGMPSSPPSRSRLAAATSISSRSARSRISAVSRQPCSSTVIGIQFRVVSSRRVDRVGVDRRADLGDEGAQRFVGHPAAHRERRPAPVLVADERARPGGVEVLDRAAFGLGADLFDAVDLEQRVGVVGDDAEALAEFAAPVRSGSPCVPAALRGSAPASGARALARGSGRSSPRRRSSFSGGIGSPSQRLTVAISTQLFEPLGGTGDRRFGGRRRSGTRYIPIP